MRVKTDEVLKNLTLADAIAIEKAAKARITREGSEAETTGGNYRIILEATDASKLAEIQEAAKRS